MLVAAALVLDVQHLAGEGAVEKTLFLAGFDALDMAFLQLQADVRSISQQRDAAPRGVENHRRPGARGVVERDAG